MRRTLTLALLLLAATSVFAADDVIRKGFNVADGGTLRLDAGFGNIKIVAGGTGVAVEVVRKADGRKAEQRMRDMKITFSQQGNDVVIDMDDDDDHSHWSRWFDWNDLELQWNIRVPVHYNVNAKTSGGSIDLSDLGGTVEARTSGGSISTGRLSGPAVLRTSGGSVTIEGGGGKIDARTSGGSIRVGDTTGPVDVHTSGGSITLAHVRGAVRAHTSGGGISIEDAAGSVEASTSGGSIRAQISGPITADSKLSTSGGGITLTISPSAAIDLDARASGGDVDTDVPITVQGRQEDDRVVGKINGGGPRLVLRTSGGGIRVKGL